MCVCVCVCVCEFVYTLASLVCMCRMCIAVIISNFSTQFPLLIFHNREEDPNRPTSSLKCVDDILGARDGRFGGIAAIGMNVVTGKFGLLTNCRYKPQIDVNGESRGLLLSEVLRACDTHVDPTRKFQGGFHMYSGSLFLKIGVPPVVDYDSNIPHSGRHTCVKTLDVHVRMNEHPTNVSQWVKLKFLKQKIELILSIMDPKTTSMEDLFQKITDCLSDASPIELLEWQDNFTCTHSERVDTCTLEARAELVDTSTRNEHVHTCKRDTQVEDQYMSSFLKPLTVPMNELDSIFGSFEDADSKNLLNEANFGVSSLRESLFLTSVDVPHVESAPTVEISNVNVPTENTVDVSVPTKELSNVSGPTEATPTAPTGDAVSGDSPIPVADANAGDTAVDGAPTDDHSSFNYDWSMFPPEVEEIIQKYIFVPPTSFGNITYGTVSQTFVCVDALTREVHYMYRRVASGQFSAWDHRIIPYVCRSEF